MDVPHNFETDLQEAKDLSDSGIFSCTEALQDEELFFRKRRKLSPGSGMHVLGDVGYGMFYTELFKKNYQTGSAIQHDIICPEEIGCQLNKPIYLTSTNRTAKGVEAFMVFEGKKQYFRVFDWSRTDQWQTLIPEKQLEEYFSTRNIDGKLCRVICVVNATLQVAPGEWINRVFLKNVSSGKLDLIYKHSYSCTLEIQQSDYIGSWGPIVETFQEDHKGLNILGFADVCLGNRDSDGQWTVYKKLGDAECVVRDDKKGLHMDYLLSNYTFLCSGD